MPRSWPPGSAAEGIVTQLQGNVSGPYPFGAVSVLVEAGQAELAGGAPPGGRSRSRLLRTAATQLPQCRRGPRPGAGEDDVPGCVDDILGFADDPGRPFARHLASPWRRAAAAVAAVLVAGAPVLAHFIGQ